MFKRDTNAARQARSRDSDLEQRVRRDLTFLFDQYGAIVSSSTLQGHGNSEVSVAVGNLEFQFAKNQRDGEDRAVVGWGVAEFFPIDTTPSMHIPSRRVLNPPIGDPAFQALVISRCLHSPARTTQYHTSGPGRFAVSGPVLALVLAT